MKLATKLLLSIALFAAIAQQSCTDQKESNGATLAVLALAAASGSSTGSGLTSLPQPALNTATMVLGDTTLTLTNRLACETGIAGIGFRMVDADNLPSLFIEDIDFTMQSGISVGPGGSTLHIDVPGGMLNPSQKCPATLKENTANVYDLQVIGCPLVPGANNPVPSSATVSFRVRCSK